MRIKDFLNTYQKLPKKNKIETVQQLLADGLKKYSGTEYFKPVVNEVLKPCIDGLNDYEDNSHFPISIVYQDEGIRKNAYIAPGTIFEPSDNNKLLFQGKRIQFNVNNIVDVII